MGTIVSAVIDTLRDAGIRADEAYPGGRIPALTGPVAAVRLGKIDRSVRSTAVQVVLMGPAKSGGSTCERTALQAIEALQAMGGTCRKEVCKFDELADVFYIEVEAEFFGTAKADTWSPGPGFAVTIGQQSMDCAVAFSLQRAVSGTETDIQNAPWQFTLEELLPPDSTEPPDPKEPFTMTVVRSRFDEVFTGCRFTSVKRQDTLRGVSQIRTGTAETRTATGIL